MFLAERFNGESELFLFRSQLTPHVSFVALCGSTSSIVGDRRVQNRIDENLAGLVLQVEEFEILDRVCSGFLRTSDNKFGNRCSAQCSRALDEALLLWSNPGLQPVFLSRATGSLLDLWHSHLAGSIKSSVRRIDVHVKGLKFGGGIVGHSASWPDGTTAEKGRRCCSAGGRTQHRLIERDADPWGGDSAPFTNFNREPSEPGKWPWSPRYRRS